MEIRIAVVSLWAEDMPATAHFYRDGIGLPLKAYLAGDHPHFDLGGTFLTIIQGRPALPAGEEPRFPVVAFRVPNLETAVEKLRSYGVDLPSGVETGASGKWVMFHDPAGNLIELVEIKSPVVNSRS